MELNHQDAYGIMEILPSDPDIRGKIMRLEETMMNLPESMKDDLPVEHLFSQGVYARTITIPKGCLLIGMIHKHKNLNIISKGDISVLTEDGVVRVQAGARIVSPPGVKRVGFTHEDTIWTTIHGTYEINLEEIEREFIVKEFSELVDIDIPVLGGE
jgi:hypothetical protein